MKARHGKNQNGEQRHPLRRVIVLLGLLMAIAAVLLIGLDQTGSDRDMRAHPTPTPEPDFVRQTTPLPIPQTAQPLESEAPKRTEEPHIKTTVMVDGRAVCTLASKQAAESLIDSVVDHFERLCGETNIRSELGNEIELVNSEDVEIMSFDDALALLTGEETPITVISRRLETQTELVGHEVSINRDSAYFVGTRIVVSYGIDGKNCHTVEYTYKNGEQIGSRDVEVYPLYQAVMERILIGSRPIPAADTSGEDFGRSDCPYFDWNLRHPVDLNSCKIVKEFGFYGGVLHPGIDYTCPENTICKAVRAGRVIAVLERGAYGLTVDIEHADGLITRYAGLSRAGVKVGDELSIADQIGYTDKSEFHFEMILDGRPRNPRIYLFKLFD